MGPFLRIWGWQASDRASRPSIYSHSVERMAGSALAAYGRSADFFQRPDSCQASGGNRLCGRYGPEDTKRAFRLSLTFAAGAAVTFTVLGVIASLAGRLMGNGATWWYIVLGVLMVLMALQTWGIFEIIPSSYLISKNTKRGYVGAFIAGILGGVFSSPAQRLY